MTELPFVTTTLALLSRIIPGVRKPLANPVIQIKGDNNQVFIIRKAD